jgi:hypothetical protein
MYNLNFDILSFDGVGEKMGRKFSRWVDFFRIFIGRVFTVGVFFISEATQINGLLFARCKLCLSFDLKNRLGYILGIFSQTHRVTLFLGPFSKAGRIVHHLRLLLSTQTAAGHTVQNLQGMFHQQLTHTPCYTTSG